ncbi:UNVERIFIED_CONTAM: hypothetical protein Sangu_1394300 [Sesamum angustifolium]|uniref:Reverse transcriptase zinc-binding domain-containing protein n=1 Tax=Sesamum angustifolium TaxID=2727405 RepID=A0AAW2N5L1_9LAMI
MAEGGLGVRSLADYVRAFSMKLWWRFRGKSSLWLEYLHGRYCRNLHPTIVLYNRNHSSVWHHLCRIRDVAELFLFWTLGEGSVSFWHDNWLGEKPLAQLLHRDTYTMEPIPIAADQGDKIVWTGSSTGDFSTNSAWKAIRQVSPRRQLLADVWHRSLRPTISVFLWRLFQDRIPVDARIRQKGFSFPSKWTSVLAELTAVWRGMELALTHGLAPLVVEVDATTLLVVDVQHVFREANGAADHLTKEAASLQLTQLDLGLGGRSASGVHRSSRPFCRRCAPGLNWPGRASGAVTLKKLECSKQAYALYTLAWDNIIGFRSYYVGLRIGVMINKDSRGHSYFIVRERKLGARRRSDTVLVSTINDADQGSADVAFRTPPAPYEKSKSLGSGGSMVARLKLKGIDGRAPPGVEPAA